MFVLILIGAAVNCRMVGVVPSYMWKECHAKRLVEKQNRGEEEVPMVRHHGEKRTHREVKNCNRRLFRWGRGGEERKSKCVLRW